MAAIVLVYAVGFSLVLFIGWQFLYFPFHFFESS